MVLVFRHVFAMCAEGLNVLLFFFFTPVSIGQGAIARSFRVEFFYLSGWNSCLFLAFGCWCFGFILLGTTCFSLDTFFQPHELPNTHQPFSRPRLKHIWIILPWWLYVGIFPVSNFRAFFFFCVFLPWQMKIIGCGK